MKLTSYVYCQDTKIENENTVIIAPHQMLTPINLPTNYSFTISFGLLGKPNEFIDKQVVVTFKNPNDEEISKNTFDMPQIPKEVTGTENYIGIQLNLSLMNVVLNTAGVYNTVIEVNGEVLKECPIDVYVSQ